MNYTDTLVALILGGLYCAHAGLTAKVNFALILPILITHAQARSGQPAVALDGQLTTMMAQGPSWFDTHFEYLFEIYAHMSVKSQLNKAHRKLKAVVICVVLH